MAQDRYKYFRIEARELIEGLTQGLLELERGQAPASCLDAMLRMAHTLKGAARVVGVAQAAEAAHALEDLLSPHRQSSAPVPAETVAEGFRLTDAMRQAIAALTAPPPARERMAVIPASEEAIETVRVELAAMDGLLEAMAETAVQLDGLQHELGELDALRRLAATLVEALPAEHGRPGSPRGLAETLLGRLDRARTAFESRLDRTAVEHDEARALANRLRLVPAQAVFSQLERAVRDAAATAGKRVQLEATGGDTKLDGPVLLELRDALLHVVRNAVAHGIEPEPQRLAAGKPAEGRVRLHVERQGSRVAFVCEDDGAGIDAAAVRQAAVRQGLLGPAEAAALQDEAALGLIFEGGLTTGRTVTELSGRGVGLDVVRAVTTRLKGEVAVNSRPGAGTTIALTVPLSLSALPALVLEAGALRAALPLEAVVGAWRVPHDQIASVGGRLSAMIAGEAMAFLPLALAFGAPGEAPEAWSVVVVRVGEAQAAIGVERLLGATELVVRPLPAIVGPLPLVAGASLDAEGCPQPVLDPAGLVRLAYAGLAPAPAAARPAPILVVDDSLTTRMLEQSILEAAGYEVELACSAEEALGMARQNRYALFIVDVEMPGMDGFEFVATTRQDAALSRVPAILVTSRHAAADRRRGLEAGAKAYIVKGEFDQGRFLGTVRELVG